MEESVTTTHTCVETGVWRFFMSWCLRCDCGSDEDQDYQDSVSRRRSQVEVRCECLGLTGKRVVSDFYRRHSSAERAAGCLFELGPALFSSVRLDLQDVCSALDFPPSRSHSASARQKNSYGRKPTAAADIRLSSFTVEASSCFCRLCWKTPDSFLMYTRRQSLGIEQDAVDDE